jgi:hypothetical protein
MISLSFDTLEERSLLSHFSMPALPDWDLPGEHAGGPSPVDFGAPNRAQGQFDSGPYFFFPPRSPSASSQASSAMDFVVSANPVAPSSPTVQAVIPKVALPGQGSEGATGGGQADIAQAIAAASAASPAFVPAPVAPKPVEISTGMISVVSSGLARLVPVTLGLIVPDVLSARAWGAQSGPLFTEPETVKTPRGASSDLAAPGNNAWKPTFSLPAPQGADLITEIGGFRHTPLGESLKRLFGGATDSDGRPSREIHNPSYLLPIALAAAGFEAVRRWRQSSKWASGRSRRVRNSLLIGLPRTPR